MKVTKITSMALSDEQGFGAHYVKIDTDVGIYGLGEVGRTVWGEAIGRAIDHLGEIVIGQDPFATERVWQHMFRGNFFPADGVYASAISAIDIALWDIKGKALDMPVYKLLGGPVRDKVVCYPHNAGRTVEELVASCAKSVEDGWKFVRWGQAETSPDGSIDYSEGGILDPVRSIIKTEETVAAVREVVGPEIHICLDVHTRIDTTHVITMCRNLEKYNPFFVEDPLRSENPESYRKLDRHVDVPIAAGEQWGSKWAFRQVIEEELISYARIDLCNVGGLTEALKVTHWCETHYIDIAPHNPLGPVSAAACVALCMASTNVGVQEMPKAPQTYEIELFPQQIDWADGYAFATGEPGLGVDIDMAVAESRAVSGRGWVPQLRRSDGAFTNW
jgi:galactonate dehydratase